MAGRRHNAHQQMRIYGNQQRHSAVERLDEKSIGAGVQRDAEPEMGAAAGSVDGDRELTWLVPVWEHDVETWYRSTGNGDFGRGPSSTTLPSMPMRVGQNGAQSTHTAHNLREWLSNDLNCTGTAVPDSNKETVKSLLRAKQIPDSGPASVDATAQRNAKRHRKKPKKS